MKVVINDKDVFDVAYTKTSGSRGREHFLRDSQGRIVRTCYAVRPNERVQVGGEVLQGKND